MPSMVSYPRRLQSGQITCYLNRTYHVLTTRGIVFSGCVGPFPVHRRAFVRRQGPAPLPAEPRVPAGLLCAAVAVKPLPRDQSRDCHLDQRHSSVRRGDPWGYNPDLSFLCGKHRDQISREADCSPPPAHKGHIRKAHLRKDSGDVPSSLAPPRQCPQEQNRARLDIAVSPALCVASRRHLIIDPTETATADLLGCWREAKDSAHSCTRLYAASRSTMDLYQPAPQPAWSPALPDWPDILSVDPATGLCHPDASFGWVKHPRPVARAPTNAVLALVLVPSGSPANFRDSPEKKAGASGRLASEPAPAARASALRLPQSPGSRKSERRRSATAPSVRSDSSRICPLAPASWARRRLNSTIRPASLFTTSRI